MNAEQDIGRVTFRDVDDHEVSLGSYRGQMLVLVGGGRGSMREAMRWGVALAERLGADPRVRLVAVAFVDRLPVFLPKRLVRESIKRFSPIEPLLDWDGHAATDLELAGPDEAHVWVIDPSSVLRHVITGPFTRAGVEEIAELVARILA